MISKVEKKVVCQIVHLNFNKNVRPPDVSEGMKTTTDRTWYFNAVFTWGYIEVGIPKTLCFSSPETNAQNKYRDSLLSGNISFTHLLLKKH